MFFRKIFCALRAVWGGDLRGMVWYGFIVQTDYGDVFCGVCITACLLPAYHEPGVSAALSQDGGVSAALAEGDRADKKEKMLADSVWLECSTIYCPVKNILLYRSGTQDSVKIPKSIFMIYLRKKGQSGYWQEAVRKKSDSE